MGNTISSEQFSEICNAVWRDRASVLSGRGFLTAEAALVRAVYWRLCKAGVGGAAGRDMKSYGETVATYQTVVECVLELNSSPRFHSAPFLKELVERCQGEVGGGAFSQ